MLGHEDSPDDLVTVVADGKASAKVAWAASCLSCCASSTPAAIPEDTTAAVMRALQSELEETKECSRREVHVALLTLLVELCRVRAQDLQAVAKVLAELPPPPPKRPRGGPQRFTADEEPMPVTLLHRILTIMADEFEEALAGCSFVHGCHLLVLAISVEEGLPELLCRMGALRMVAHCLQEVGRLDAGVTVEQRRDLMATEWMPFADAAMRLMHAVVCAPSFHASSDPAASQVLDAAMSTLHRALPECGTSLSVQPIHVHGLSMLGKLARLTQDLGQRILHTNGMPLGMRVLAIAGATCDDVSLALWYLAQLATVSRHSAKKLAALGAEDVAHRAMDKYSSSKDVNEQAARVIQACRPRF